MDCKYLDSISLRMHTVETKCWASTNCKQMIAIFWSNAKKRYGRCRCIVFSITWYSRLEKPASKSSRTDFGNTGFICSSWCSFARVTCKYTILLVLKTRVAESEVKYPTQTFYNFQLRLCNIKEIKFGCKIHGHRGTEQEISVSTKVSKEIVIFPQEFPF